MLYTLVEMNRAALAPMRLLAKGTLHALEHPLNPWTNSAVGRAAHAASSVFERATRYYGKPEWQIPSTEIDGQTCAVTPVTTWSTNWCNLIHFETEGAPAGRPRLLICAPLSGHFATLLRGTVEAFLPTHDVFITDWTDAKMAPVWYGRFDLDDYIDHVRSALQQIGGGAHVVAVCQPGPAVLAAISMMSEDEDPVISMSLEEMRLCPRVVALAGGIDKVAAIKGALNGGLIDVLITDRVTAEALLATR